MSDNLDEIIAHTRAGFGARRVEKPRVEAPPSPITGDPARPASAAVNAKQQMSYADAMEMKRSGALRSAVLTEAGWVTP